MKFLTDVAVPRLIIDSLRARGHDVQRVHEVGLDRSADGDIMEQARKTGRSVITHDLDFGTLLAASGDDAPSVVILRIGQSEPCVQLARLIVALERHGHLLDEGVVLLVSASSERIRRLPILRDSLR